MSSREEEEENSNVVSHRVEAPMAGTGEAAAMAQPVVGEHAYAADSDMMADEGARQPHKEQGQQQEQEGGNVPQPQPQPGQPQQQQQELHLDKRKHDEAVGADAGEGPEPATKLPRREESAAEAEAGGHEEAKPEEATSEEKGQEDGEEAKNEDKGEEGPRGEEGRRTLDPAAVESFVKKHLNTREPQLTWEMQRFADTVELTSPNFMMVWKEYERQKALAKESKSSKRKTAAAAKKPRGGAAAAAKNANQPAAEGEGVHGIAASVTSRRRGSKKAATT